MRLLKPLFKDDNAREIAKKHQNHMHDLITDWIEQNPKVCYGVFKNFADNFKVMSPNTDMPGLLSGTAVRMRVNDNGHHYSYWHSATLTAHMVILHSKFFDLEITADTVSLVNRAVSSECKFNELGEINRVTDTGFDAWKTLTMQLTDLSVSEAVVNLTEGRGFYSSVIEPKCTWGPYDLVGLPIIKKQIHLDGFKLANRYNLLTLRIIDSNDAYTYQFYIKGCNGSSDYLLYDTGTPEPKFDDRYLLLPLATRCFYIEYLASVLRTLAN